MSPAASTAWPGRTTPPDRPHHGVQQPEVRLVLLLLPREGIGHLRHAGEDGAPLRILLQPVERLQKIRRLDASQVGPLALEVVEPHPAEWLQIASETPLAASRSLGDGAHLS